MWVGQRHKKNFNFKTEEHKKIELPAGPMGFYTFITFLGWGGGLAGGMYFIYFFNII